MSTKRNHLVFLLLLLFLFPLSACGKKEADTAGLNDKAQENSPSEAMAEAMAEPSNETQAKDPAESGSVRPAIDMPKQAQEIGRKGGKCFQ